MGNFFTKIKKTLFTRTMMGRIFILFLGWALVAFGISLMLEINFGVAPYDVLATAVAGLINTSPGVAMWVVGGLALIGGWLAGERPGIGTFAGAFFIGLFVDVYMRVIPNDIPLVGRLFILIPTFVSLYIGVCLIITSKLGAGPSEIVMLAICKKGVSIRTSRWIVEAGTLLIGYLLGGEAGVLSLVVVLIAGPMISLFLPRIQRMLPLTTKN
jgi:uncharacterized membrane protein YczE